jgi:hypothetical protein
MTPAEAPSIIEVSPEDARRVQTQTDLNVPKSQNAAQLLSVRGLSTHFFTPDGVVQAELVAADAGRLSHRRA